MSPEQLAALIVALVVLIGVPVLLASLYEMNWVKPPSEPQKPEMVLLSCDCDHEVVCPQGRRPEQPRCQIFIEKRLVK